MKATEGAHSLMTELGQWRSERVLTHSYVNWGNGGQRRYSLTAIWTGAMKAKEGTHSQLCELGQWRSESNYAQDPITGGRLRIRPAR